MEEAIVQEEMMIRQQYAKLLLVCHWKPKVELICLEDARKLKFAKGLMSYKIALRSVGGQTHKMRRFIQWSKEKKVIRK
jgi:hypothetical protein